MTTAAGGDAFAAAVAASPLRGALRPGAAAGDDPPARAAGALLERGLARLARGHVEGAVEGPGALVAGDTWTAAVRRLADRLLLPAVGAGGTVDLPALSPAAEAVVRTLYPEPATGAATAALPPARPAWGGGLVVVLGCGRSGTTWLERMLMASPLAGGVDGAESFLFEQCSPLWSCLPDLAPLVDTGRLVPALRELCDTVFSGALQLHSPQATHFVEKTPLHSLIVPQLRAVYPEAAYVHLVRDGRDVARSISQVPFFRLPDPADAAALWRRVVEEVRAQAPQLPRYREVRYEQLLADPVRQVSALLAWMGLPVTEQTSAELAARAAARVSTHAGVTQAVGSGTWRALPRRDLARVYAEAGVLLVTEGYATAGQRHRQRLHPSYWQRRLVRARRRLG